MPVKITEKLQTAIRRHGEKTYPHECCGFILGHSNESSFEAVKLIAAENQRKDAPHNRYTISPIDYLKVEKQADAGNLQIIGFYHSHPDHPAQPSQYDIEHAWPHLVYVIAAVQQGESKDLNAFQLSDNRERFHSIVIT